MSNPADWMSHMGGILSGAIGEIASGNAFNTSILYVESCKNGGNIFDAKYILQANGIKKCWPAPMGKDAGEDIGIISVPKSDTERALAILNKAGFFAWKSPL